MNANFTFNFINKTIVCSKTALRKAGDPTTKEYTELMSMIEKQPTFTVVERTIQKNASKKSYNGLTIAFMTSYIESHDNKEKMMAEFQQAQTMGGYPMAKSWFLRSYPNFQMTAGRKVVAEQKVNKVRATAKVIPMNTKSAANQ